MSRGAIYVEDSGNSKIACGEKVDTTYVAIKQSCPDSCKLKDAGCYAQVSYVAMVNKRNERRVRGGSAVDVAKAEAAAIDKSYGGGDVPVGRVLRIHTAGDSRTRRGTRLIAAAVNRWKKRGGGAAWSYSHAYKHVPRSYWGSVSILASVDGVEDIESARKNGYAPAIVVAEHVSEKAYKLVGSEVKFIPCPAQTKPGGKEVSCVKCRLCFSADRLFENGMGISFAAHGVKQGAVKRRLEMVK